MTDHAHNPDAPPPMTGWKEPAFRALFHATQHQFSEVAQALADLMATEQPRRSMCNALFAWAGTLQKALPGTVCEHATFMFVPADNPVSSEMVSVDDVPSCAAWAGRFAFAVLRDDDEQIDALMTTFVHMNDEDTCDAAFSLLTMCAATIRHLFDQPEIRDVLISRMNEEIAATADPVGEAEKILAEAAGDGTQ